MSAGHVASTEKMANCEWLVRPWRSSAGRARSARSAWRPLGSRRVLRWSLARARARRRDAAREIKSVNGVPPYGRRQAGCGAGRRHSRYRGALFEPRRDPRTRSVTALAGKIVVDAAVPLCRPRCRSCSFPRRSGPRTLRRRSSATGCEVVSAFHMSGRKAACGRCDRL